jgi:hypothetical protein
MKPTIRFDVKKKEYRCTNNIGGWVGFGKTPELSYVHYICMNGGWNSYHLAA